jgi:N6-adenosine-specific RNA methylase IME4
VSASLPFKVICADPPWSFGDRLPGPSRGAAKNYKVMSLEDVCRFPLPALAGDCWLFLWRVSSQVEEAYQVVRRWGFTPKSERVWNKLTKSGKPWFGMGRSVRAAHESCIIAVRGRPLRLSASIRSTFEASVPVGPDGRYLHSGKPECFYDDVERLAAGPYVELFARRQRTNWTCLGDQLTGTQESA